MKNKYPILHKRVLATFSYWCIDNNHYIIQTVKDREKKKGYLKYVQSKISEYRGEIMGDSLLSLRSRVFLMLFTMSESLVASLQGIKIFQSDNKKILRE